MNQEKYSQRRYDFKNNIFQYTSIVLVCFLYLFSIVLLPSFKKFFPEEGWSYFNGIFGVVFGVIFYFVTLKIFKLFNLKNIKEFKDRRFFLKRNLIGFIISFSFVLIISLVYVIAGKEYEKFPIFFLTAIPSLVFALRPAIIEEVVFRHTFLNFFTMKNKKYLGLILSSSIFGFIHIANALFGKPISPMHLILTLVLGFFMGVLYLEFGLIPAIIFHYLADANFVNAKDSEFMVVLIVIVGMIYLAGLFIYHRKELGKKWFKLQ